MQELYKLINTLFQGHLLECIGWNKLEQGENSTGPILIGTKKGTLFETEIDPHGGFLGRGRPEEYFTEVGSCDQSVWSVRLLLILFCCVVKLCN